MPDRLPTPPSSSKEDPSEDGSWQSAGPDTERTGSRRSDGPTDAANAADANPFAPPPEGSPDRPWQPRQQGDGKKQGGQGGGSRWSSRQPGRSSGPFGQRPGEQDGQGGGGQGGPGSGLRWDPTDPVQRRARYALLAGMWGFFFALFSWTYVGLLLGALALYWGISSLRSDTAAKPDAKAGVAEITGGGTGQPDRATPAGQPQATAPAGTRPQKTSAISGIVVGSLALAVVAATFTVQTVYRDYYTCVNDALTTTAADRCSDLLPEQIRPLLEAETQE